MYWLRRRTPWILLTIAAAVMLVDVVGASGIWGRIGLLLGLAALLLMHERRTVEARGVAAEADHLIRGDGGGRHQR